MTRPLFFLDTVVLVPLTRGYVATIDIGDIDILAGRDWCALVSPNRHPVYACREKNGKTVLLHREIIQASPGLEVDHRDGDGLNCRRANLRECTRGQNSCNTRVRSDNKSGLKGVAWNKKDKKWVARIKSNGKLTRIGGFTTPEEAHAAYCDAAVRIHGEFARFG